MTNFEETRQKIGKVMNNDDFKTSAMILTDVIERMSNIYSNSLSRGIKSFDVPEITDMIETAKKIALQNVIK
jgi:hypothetical protein